MRKRSHRQQRPCSAPMLINRGLQNDALEMRERQIVEAFAHGYAGTTHFDELADMRNMLTLAAAHKDDTQIQNLCDAMRIPLGNLRIRYAETGRMGVTGDELQLLREFVGIYKDFWLRQPVSLYEAACDGLQRAIYDVKSDTQPRSQQ